MIPDVVERKQKIRSLIIEVRNRLSDGSCRENNARIRQHILEFDAVKDANVIHTFVSMDERHEVNTRQIIQDLLEMGKKVVVPIMNGEDLRHSELGSLDDLYENKWGVPEPSTFIEFDIENLEIIFVPLLSVDKMGNRIGYGKGYYDRFLTNTNALKIGLVFEDFVLDEIPFEKHDVKLDGFISEKGVRLM